MMNAAAEPALDQAGAYWVMATVNITEITPNDENVVICSLWHRNAQTGEEHFIGEGSSAVAQGSTDAVNNLAQDMDQVVVTGGAQVNQWADITLKCRAEGREADPIIDGQMWVLQVGSF
jgi:hypothetical protein